MRILVTGAGGFVGHWACRSLTEAGHEVIPSDRKPEGTRLTELDITQPEQIEAALKAHRPEACLHLAGIAFVPLAWDNPDLAFQVNTLGTLNLLEGLRKHSPQTKFLMASSAEVYGRQPLDHPITEEAPLNPSNLYAVSKAAADQSVLLYASRYGMHTMTVRPQNHIGPGQSKSFVASSFAHQITSIKANKSPDEMQVGNLKAQRDFLDVRDVSEGYRLLLEQGQAGEAYNLSSERPVSIQLILDTLCNLADCHPTVRVDPDRYREESGLPILLSDKIKRHTYWEPVFGLKQTLADLLQSIQV